MNAEYDFTKTWFLQSEIKKHAEQYFDHKKRYAILEIGCFEGMSACFFSDNFLDNKDSTLDCVDPFYTSGTVELLKRSSCLKTTLVEAKITTKSIFTK